MNLKQLYQDIILEHGTNPRNLGKCEGHSHEAKGYNPLCGDKVHVYLKLDNGKKVECLTFEGDGCAISLASASIMTELIRGKSINDAKEIMNAFLNMIKNTSKIQSNHLDEDQKTKLMSLSGVKQYPMRVKCATLSWHTLISAIDNTQEEINTERLD
jgi:nitrogen fixation NifU-like protein